MKRLTLEYVKEEFKKEGYKLISKNYKNCNTKLDVICPKGHFWQPTLGNFKAGHKCFYCSYGKDIRLKKFSYIFVKNEIEKYNYILSSKIYKGCYDYLDIICPEGHKYKTTFSNFRSGYRCRKCYNKNLIRENNPNWRNYSENDIKKFKWYKERVRQITNNNYRKYKELINSKKLKRSKIDNHLDHIFSIKEAFDNKISPEIVSSIYNLRMLPAIKNIQKRNKSPITKYLLYHIAN